jgi:hypothetical protein
MTTQPELNNYEKRLLELAKSDDSIVRYRRSMLINSILYSGLFAFATYAIDWSQRATSLYYIIAGVLAVYSLLSGFAVINFHRALNTYRALLGKLTGEVITEREESQSGKNMVMLTIFYWCMLLAVILLPLTFKHYYFAGAFAFFMLLSAAIKYRYATILLEYRHRCAECADTAK